MSDRPVTIWGMGRYYSGPPAWAAARGEFSAFFYRRRVEPGVPVEVWQAWHDHESDGSRCKRCGVEWPCQPVLDLVARWSDHPDYQEAWRDGHAMHRG